MRLGGLMVVGAVVGCTLDYSSKHHDAGVMGDAPIDAPIDASCPAVPANVYIGDCVPHGLATIAIDGTWRMTGSSSYSSGSNSSTSTIDHDATIQRYGCQVGFGSGSATPVAGMFTYVSDTALAYFCSYYAPCPRGMESWSICVRSGDGALRYSAYAYGYATGVEWMSQASGVLTR